MERLSWQVEHGNRDNSPGGGSIEMKMLAINGSPRGAAGNTEVILQAFLEGAREAGAEVMSRRSSSPA